MNTIRMLLLVVVVGCGSDEKKQGSQERDDVGHDAGTAPARDATDAFVIEGEHVVSIRGAESTCGDWVDALTPSVPELLEVPELPEAIEAALDIQFRPPLIPVNGVVAYADGSGGLLTDSFYFSGIEISETCLVDLTATLRVDSGGMGAFLFDPSAAGACPELCEAAVLVTLGPL